MKDFIVATKNQGKIKEIREILRDFNFDIKSMKEIDLDIDIEENGTTFEENSLIKAREVAKLTNTIVMADDSGLEIDYLNGEPGIRSARYLGEDTSYDIKNNKILDMLKDVPFEKRTARFVCAIAVVFEDGREFVVTETIEGHIAYEPAGDNGFGYDPIFFVKEYDLTTAQLSSEQKHEISHRGKALKLMREKIKDQI